jgi:DNA-binding HxlR family transcriptional regulator
VRAGAQALSLLSAPLNVHIVQALAKEPRSLVELRRSVGSPPQTTLRGNLRLLTEIGALERRRQNSFPGSLDFELTSSGRDLWQVAETLRVWLAIAPDGPITLGGVGAKSSIKALVEGWSTTLVRALAAKPLSLTELSRLITGLSYPSLERRLVAMRLVGQIEPYPSNGRGTPYAVGDWLRHATGPLLAATRWERANMPAAAPLSKIDVEAIFLLATPPLRLPEDLSGTCRLAVEMRGPGGESRLAGVLVDVASGRIVSCIARLSGNADGWASGSTGAWLKAIIEREPGGLEVGGNCELVVTLIENLHGTLFRSRQPT